MGRMRPSCNFAISALTTCYAQLDDRSRSRSRVDLAFCATIIMEQILRYFMAPRLGRGTIFAKYTHEGGALITIELASQVAGRSRVELRAAPSQVNSMPSSGIHALYRLRRHAISQVQHYVKGELLDCNELELDCSNRPWNGDLAESPYGGATMGFIEAKTLGGSSALGRISLAFRLRRGG